MQIKKIVRLSMLLAISIVLSLIESFIPFFSGLIPGLKIGLANIIILFCLYTFTSKDALFVSIMRVIIIGIIRTGLFSATFLFSLGGALLSISIMIISKKYLKCSMVGTSILGSTFHTIGQILIAIIIIKNINIIYYLPWLLLFSIPTGIIIGLISKGLVNNFKNIVNLS